MAAIPTQITLFLASNLLWGLYMLATLQTPDKFDDPKGPRWRKFWSRRSSWLWRSSFMWRSSWLKVVLNVKVVFYVNVVLIVKGVLIVKVVFIVNDGCSNPSLSRITNILLSFQHPRTHLRIEPGPVSSGPHSCDWCQVIRDEDAGRMEDHGDWILFHPLTITETGSSAILYL